MNPKTAGHLPANGYAARIVDGTDWENIIEAEKTIAGFNTILTLKSLEGVFEAYIDLSRKKRQGAIYTPEHIIDYLILEGLKTSGKGKAFRILDPACGSSGFLLRAATQLERHFGVHHKRVFVENLFGIDNDAIVLEHARCLIELYMAERGIVFDSNKVNLIYGDTLLLDSLFAAEGDTKPGWRPGSSHEPALCKTSEPQRGISEHIVPALSKLYTVQF